MPREIHCVLISKTPDCIVRTGFEVVGGALVVATALEVHRQLGRDLNGAIAVNLLAALRDQPVQPHASRCGYPVVQNVLVKSMNKAKPRYDLAVR